MAKKRMYSFAKEKHSGKVFFQRYLVHSHLSFLPFWHGWHIIWTDRVAFTWAASGCLAWYLPSAVSCSD